MGECLITRRGGEPYKLPVLDENYPMDLTVINGATATFYVRFAEQGKPADYAYQWYVNGIAVDGATDSTYVRNTSSDKGTYQVYCEVINKAGTVSSRVAACIVQKAPVLNTNYPLDKTASVEGENVIFEAVIADAGVPNEYTYQWYYNDSPISGATGSTYNMAAPFDQGFVHCVVSNVAGSVTSRTATVQSNICYLFNYGDNSAVTGGWRAVAKPVDTEHAFQVAPVITTNNNGSITIGCGHMGGGIYYTQNKINLKDIKTIEFDGSMTTPDYAAWVGLYVWSSLGQLISSNVVANAYGHAKATRHNATVDVSKLTGSYYIGFGLYGLSTNATTVVLNKLSINR